MAIQEAEVGASQVPRARLLEIGVGCPRTVGAQVEANLVTVGAIRTVDVAIPDGTLDPRAGGAAEVRIRCQGERVWLIGGHACLSDDNVVHRVVHLDELEGATYAFFTRALLVVVLQADAHGKGLVGGGARHGRPLIARLGPGQPLLEDGVSDIASPTWRPGSDAEGPQDVGGFSPTSLGGPQVSQPVLHGQDEVGSALHLGARTPPHIAVLHVLVQDYDFFEKGVAPLGELRPGKAVLTVPAPRGDCHIVVHLLAVLGGEQSVVVVRQVHLDSQGDVLYVRETHHLARRFARSRKHGKDHRGQDSDDRDDDQQLNQSETSSIPHDLH
jgi:hypothetical protein